MSCSSSDDGTNSPTTLRGCRCWARLPKTTDGASQFTFTYTGSCDDDYSSVCRAHRPVFLRTHGPCHPPVFILHLTVGVPNSNHVVCRHLLLPPRTVAPRVQGWLSVGPERQVMLQSSREQRIWHLRLYGLLSSFSWSRVLVDMLMAQSCCRLRFTRSKMRGSTSAVH